MKKEDCRNCINNLRKFVQFNFKTDHPVNILITFYERSKEKKSQNLSNLFLYCRRAAHINFSVMQINRFAVAATRRGGALRMFKPLPPANSVSAKKQDKVARVARVYLKSDDVCAARARVTCVVYLFHLQMLLIVVVFFFFLSFHYTYLPHRTHRVLAL